MDRLDGWRLVHELRVKRRREVRNRSLWKYTEALTFFAGYGPLIKTYVQFLLAKLRFHRLRPEFNGLFEYEEYITLKGIDDPNEGCVRFQLYL